jgi:hypothetical protein
MDESRIINTPDAKIYTLLKKSSTIGRLGQVIYTYINLNFGFTTVCAGSISSKTSGPRHPKIQIYAGIPQIGCGTTIAKKILKIFFDFFSRDILYWVAEICEADPRVCIISISQQKI